MKYRLLSISLIFVLVATALFIARTRHESSQPVTILTDLSPTPIFASPNSLSSSSPSPVSTPVSKPVASPTDVTLPVPFTVQAPDADWSEPWAEGCEEAALIMVDAYNKGNRVSVLPVAETKQKIKDMVDWEIQRFGSHKDLGVDDMAIIAKEYLGYKNVTIKHSASLEDIRSAVRTGNPVIVPAAGRLLQNPYFKQPGPPYHVFVITGVAGDQFIVNENGTKQGHNYRYSAAILKAALHDYEPGVDITQTDPAYLLLKK